MLQTVLTIYLYRCVCHLTVMIVTLVPVQLRRLLMYIDGIKATCRAIMLTLVICCLKYAESSVVWMMVNIVTVICVVLILKSTTVRLCTV